MTYDAEVFLQLNTIVNYIDEVYYRFMRNINGLGKGTLNKDLCLLLKNTEYNLTLYNN